MNKWNIALGFYQDLSTALSVIDKLKQHKFLRFACIQHKKDGSFEIQRHFPVRGLGVLAAAVLACLVFGLMNYFGLIGFSWMGLGIFTALCVGAAAVYALMQFRQIFDAQLVQKFKSRILMDEIGVIVEVSQRDVREVLDILRSVKSGHPVSFLLRPTIAEENPLEIPAGTLTVEQLRQTALSLADSQQSRHVDQDKGQPLLKILSKSYRLLQLLRSDMANADYSEQSIPLSAEWLLDNMHVIEASISDVKRNLPKKYYRQLPKLISGALSGLPRIYAIAVDVIKGTSGRLNRESICAFLTSYQTHQPLTIGELWALPLMLRLRLVEWIQFLAIRVDNRMRDGELASFWGNRLLYAARHEPQRVPVFMADLSAEVVHPSAHFAEELLDHLFDQENVLPLVRNWLEQSFVEPLADILHQEQMRETSEQVIFSNAIMSLISLSQLAWPDIFESVDAVDAVLCKDPVGIYLKMDFATRNSYREAIEEMSRRSSISESAMAEYVLKLASAGVQAVEKHVGYYLIDKGRPILERLINYAPPFKIRLLRSMNAHSAGVFLGSISLLTLGFYSLLFAWLASQGWSLEKGILFFCLAFIPLSELSVQIVHLLLGWFVPASILPRMSFESGIPDNCKTLVIVPMMLLTEDSIRDEVERLEIRYLANADPLLAFGLFSDFADAPQQQAANDAHLLAIAKVGIEALNNRYGEGKFFLFHRQRVWSQSENAWIGWERKRGKLECLNCFLQGEVMPENPLCAGKSSALQGVRYVITLDSDTQLPKDQAKALIEVLAHPLNRPYLTADGKGIERGYTIIQPRVVTDFVNAKASWFCRIFSEPSAVDPYTQAISNTYQDLDAEGAYHGKGIYEVETFHRLLFNRFPQEHLLSHDLIEGAYVRVGFASPICLYDLHPAEYLAWSLRKHRWIRGDWQIADWLLPRVPTASGIKAQNPLSWMNRWKIFDNLRRSILPIALVVLLSAAWIDTSHPFVWECLAVLVLIFPSLSLFVGKLCRFSFSAWKGFGKELLLVLMRSVTTAALLPFEAYLTLDAVFRVAFRRSVSRRLLLQWTTSIHVYNSPFSVHLRFLRRLMGVSVFALLVLAAVMALNPSALTLALPFCLLWFAAPLLIYYLDKPLKDRPDKGLTEEERSMLRKVARKTWRYFDDFVGPQTHWLPPDNYQAALNVEVAQRTSPTNIGMWLFAAMAAYDFKYITLDGLIEKALATIQELNKLERYQGHFLNWYNIQSLEPLYPRYISTVDSGNFLACLWTLQQGLDEAASESILPKNPLAGIWETYRLLQEIKAAPQIPDLESLIQAASSDLSAFEQALELAIKGVLALPKESHQNPQASAWIKKLEEELDAWRELILRYFSWVQILNSLSEEQCLKIDAQASQWKAEALALRPSLKALASGEFMASFAKLLEGARRHGLPDEIGAWSKRLDEALAKSQWLAGERLGQVQSIISDIAKFSQEMHFTYLYNGERKLFAIGYNVDENKLDTSHYDLLASEARISSLVAIAKEDVPLEHWWALGRFYSTVNGRRVLLSWGGTMFEYLMPLLFNKQYRDSLIGEACHAVVACQIAYGKKRGIPWGISESAFSGIDAHKIYQYRSFGIPGMGLKRGLEDDLVVSPYSSALALAIDPSAAIKNLNRLADKPRINLWGPYGYYESIDFTRQNSPKGERGVTVYAYMAHHQGMIISSVNNLLNDSILINRFHRNSRIRGVTPLLFERIPVSPPIKLHSMLKEPSLPRLKPFSQSPVMGVVPTPESVTPKVNILSNESYSLMITNTGGGYSRWRDIDISRWRADTTQDAWGSYCYIKDLRSSDVWSATYQPTLASGDEYSVNFKSDKAEFKRRDHKIEAFTEVVVSPEDNAEIRLITLINHSEETRYLELTSYIELALAAHLADRAHPCFNKMFIETEALPEQSGLLAFRRLRSQDEAPVWAAHVVALSQTADGPIQYETDRGLFIGRGNSLQRPKALDGDLSNTTGTVLDPIFSLRCRLVLEPGRRAQVSFITAIAESRPLAAALVEKYKDLAASHRVIELAWTYAQLELRHLRIHQEEVQLFQKLASRILYPHAQLRSVEGRLRNNRLGQSGLWAQGISGDLPIVIVTVGDLYDSDLVKQLLVAHSFWSMRGLKVDLVILNEEVTGYLHPLQEQLQNLVNAYSHRGHIETPGGVFLRNSDQMPQDELNLLLAVARAILVAARGSLRQQLVSPMAKSAYPPPFIANDMVKEEPSRPLPFLELPYFNGIGGYTPDGRSYVIYLPAGMHTPAPWINVLANPQFGTLVTEAGIGCTWYGNSQENRLTPWSNDPLLNPISDVLYIRDEETGALWTPTPAPIRELDAYRVTHSQGYTRFEHNSHGIEQELLVFVPVNEEGGLPLRIQRLRLANHSSRRRKLSVTAYSAWVLGGDREDSQIYVFTEWDSESQSLFAYNRYQQDFGSHVAFCTSSLPITSYSGDRTEFLGRNRTHSNPQALERQSLSGLTGAGLDPCAALQVVVEILPGNEVELVFILGLAKDAATARRYALDCRTHGKVDQLLAQTTAWWDKTLGTIHVQLPDLVTNFALNSWLLYQTLSCRFWGRAAFYQSSGAYGFRDQLQDCLAIVYALPKIAKEHILKAASRQFLEGDVQHWWHPQSGGGVRTRFSDDLLWLPYVTAQYVRVTGDVSILQEEISFLEAALLQEDQHEAYQVPAISKETATLLEHCRRAIQKGITSGAHGLPLIGGGDWNDGMNRVGIKGKGESVWLAWFLMHVMHDFADLLCLSCCDQQAGEGYRCEAKRLAEVVETSAWDGAWYRRAYFDDGSPLGSIANVEAVIDSLAQSWAVISGMGNLERCAMALNSAEDRLVKAKERLVLLLTPPFDKTPLDPGYIKGYPPGVRENGGQYTHGSLWLAMAFARLGKGDKAVELLRMMSAPAHTQNTEDCALYRVEPYVAVADIYALKTQVGRGGWSWYTGSSAWMYRIWLEEILGFKLHGQTLTFKCALPAEWEGFSLDYRYKSSFYAITVANPHHISSGALSVVLDGAQLPSAQIPLIDDGLHHSVAIVLEKPVPPGN